MQQFKEGQWYQLPNEAWAQAIWVNESFGPIFMVFGHEPMEGYKHLYDLCINTDGTLSATGLCTWDTWRPGDLREATPDEAETQTLRALGIAKRYQPDSATKSE